MKGVRNNQIFSIDAHSSDQAKQYPMLAMAISSAISAILDFLESTPTNAEGTESLLNSTTILISSEFGRTMRQLDAPIDNTGTDHNALTSLCLVGGKGITSGLILGATDMASLDSEGKVQGLNVCHQSLDDKLLKLMGQGFDYKTGTSFVDIAPEFDSTRYLNIDSVIITVLKCVDAPLEQFRTLSARQGGDLAPLVTSLLS